MITSTSNPKVKYIARLQTSRRFRQQEQAYVVEGSRWFAELSSAQVEPILSVMTESWYQEPDNQHLLGGLAREPLLISDPVMAHISDTQTPPGILAVPPMAVRPFPPKPTLMLILDRIANPGNLGSLLRTAAAAGCDGALLAPGCVDIYNPKVLRGSMGAHLRLPLKSVTWSMIGQLVVGLAVCEATASGGQPHTSFDWRQPAALIIGSEAHGPGPAASELARQRITIPMSRATESLNAAAAAAVILFEAARQRSFRD